MELEPACRGVALSRGRPRGEQRDERAVAYIGTSRGIVGPGEVRPVAEQCGTIVVGYELDDALVAPPREPLQPRRDAGM